MRRLVTRTIFMTAILTMVMAVSVFAFDLKGGIVSTSSCVNLRKAPNTESAVLTRLPDQTRVAVLGQSNSWYKVAYNGVYGYLHRDYLKIQAVMNIQCGGAKVTTSVLNLRSKPTTSAGIVSRLSSGQVVKVIGINAGWFKVQSSKGTGYIHPEYVEITKYSGSSGSSSSGSSANAIQLSSNSSSSSGSVRSDIVSYAANFLGVKYKYGASSPSKGFDCSGLVKYVYSHFGISLSRSSASQYSGSRRISKSELKLGDLVFFSGPSGGSRVGHVGIYVGGGQFIHAPSPGKSVRYESLSNSYYARHYLGSGTVLG